MLQENFFGGDALNQPLGSDCTPLHLAAEADFVPCVEYLLGRGADVDARTRDARDAPAQGRSGRRDAGGPGSLNRGASIVARDNMRRTAYDVSSNLALRQWLPLPLQMRAEAEEPSQAAAAPPPPGQARRRRGPCRRTAPPR